MPKGNHTITVRDSVLNTTDVTFFTKLWDVKITESPAATNEEINNSSCVLNDNVTLTWDNSGLFGWTLEDGYLKSGNFGHKNSASEISFSYSSMHTTNISFKYQNNDYSSSHHVEVYVDGQRAYESNNYQGENSVAFRLPKGNHKITVRDSVLNTTDVRYFAKLWDVKLHEYEAPESVLLTERSMTISFEDVGKQPWFSEGNCIRSNNGFEANSNSVMRSTIVVDKPTKLSFNVKTNSYYADSHVFSFRINDKLHYISENSDWNYVSTILQPGTYTLEWKDENKHKGLESYYSLIKELELHQNWINIATTPGLLGIETLYKVNVLTDVELMKVTGSLNESDWATIKMMTNLHGLDLSGTNITSIPAKAFDGLKHLNTIALPEGLKRIEESAFRNTDIKYLHIPASVTYIGKESFYQTPLHNITFAEDAQLQSIGYQAFRECHWLEEFIMPNTVTSLECYSNKDEDASTFYNCYRLKKISFSDNLSFLPAYTCYQCSAIDELHLPNNISSIGRYFLHNNDGKLHIRSIEFPSTLKSIGEHAFEGLGKIKRLELPEKLTSLGYCAFRYAYELEEVILPSGIIDYNKVFERCGSIQTIICRSATPPSIVSDPFNSITKANVTLKVPDFAIATYKLDSYWYQFGNIVEGEPTDYWRIRGDLRLLNNRRMEGKPDIDLWYGGRLTVGGDAPMTIGKFDIYNSSSHNSSFVTDCPSITADEINSIYSIDANKWNFITPMIDIDLQQIHVTGSTNYVFRYYDGATRAEIGAGSSWKNVNDMKLKAGIGYIFQCDKSCDIVFPVPVELHSKILTTENITLPLTAHPSDNKANKGWNYVGNPYPSFYDIYYMDFTAPITVWDGNTYRAYSITDDDYVLEPMQGFFVQKPDAVDAIVLQSAGRQVEWTVKRPKALPAKTRNNSNTKRAIFNIEIGCDSTKDMTRIVLNEHASMAYEIECDAAKFMSMNNEVPQIYTLDSELNKLAINERPCSEESIPLGIFLPTTKKTYTISLSRSDGMVFLYDSKENIYHDFSNGDYQFTSSYEGFNDTRFTLTLKNITPSNINDASQNETHINVMASNEGVHILNAAGHEYKVASVDGRIHATSTANNNHVFVSLPNGIYIAKVGQKTYKILVE